MKWLVGLEVKAGEGRDEAGGVWTELAVPSKSRCKGKIQRRWKERKLRSDWGA